MTYSEEEKREELTKEELVTVLKLRDLVAPGEVTDDRAKRGSQLLYALPSDKLLDVARRLVVKNERVDAIAEELATEDVTKEDLHFAVLRFKIKAGAYRGQLIGKDDTTLPSPKRFRELPTTFSEGGDPKEVLMECLVAPEDADPVTDMAFLVEIQKRRLIQQTIELAKSPSAFMLNTQFLKSVETLAKLLKELARMQVEFGLRRTVPKQIDVRVQGAFQTFVNNMGDRGKDNMMTLVNNVLSILDEEDVVDADAVELTESASSSD